MSMLVSLTHETVAQLQLSAAHPSSVTLAAGGGGILDWMTAKNAATATLLRGMSVTAAIIFVLYHAIQSRLAMARMIIAIVAAGVLVWGVWNVTAIQSRVNNEVNSSPAVLETTHLAGVLA